MQNIRDNKAFDHKKTIYFVISIKIWNSGLGP